MAILSEKTASPSDIARELGEPLGVISYHVCILDELGAAELVHTKPRRGALEHYYRATARPFVSDRSWARVPASVGTQAPTLSDIRREVAAAVDEGSFDRRTDRHLSWTNLYLDQRGWSEISDLLASVSERALQIQARSARRVAKANGSLPPTSKLVMMHFEAAARAAPPRTKTRQTQHARRATSRPDA